MAYRPKLKVSFTERDFGMKHFLKEAAKIRKKPYVKAGVTQAKGSRVHAVKEGSKTKQKMTVAEIAAVHEYGSSDGRVPERPYMRSTRRKNQAKYDALIKNLKDQVFDVKTGMTTERALGIVGQAFVADVKNTIRAGIAPPLAASTIREKNKAVIGKAEAKIRGLNAKVSLSKRDKTSLDQASETVRTGGASTPLIDTAQMINSMSYEVNMEGTG